MREEDLSIFRKKWPGWYDICKPKLITVHSPVSEEMLVVSQTSGCQLEELRVTEWDFNNPNPNRKDVLIVNNTLMYSPDPKLWFRNIFECCRYLWLQDGVEGIRGNNGNYLGEDADMQRYSCSPHWKSEWEGAYDLKDIFRDRLIDWQVYSLNSPGKHFVALLKGDLHEDMQKKTVRIKQTSKTEKKVDPEIVGRALGAVGYESIKKEAETEEVVATDAEEREED